MNIQSAFNKVFAQAISKAVTQDNMIFMFECKDDIAVDNSDIKYCEISLINYNDNQQIIHACYENEQDDGYSELSFNIEDMSTEQSLIDELNKMKSIIVRSNKI